MNFGWMASSIIARSHSELMEWKSPLHDLCECNHFDEIYKCVSKWVMQMVYTLCARWFEFPLADTWSKKSRAHVTPRCQLNIQHHPGNERVHLQMHLFKGDTNQQRESHGAICHTQRKERRRARAVRASCVYMVFVVEVKQTCLLISRRYCLRTHKERRPGRTWRALVSNYVMVYCGSLLFK